MEIMINHKYPAAIRMLIKMMGAARFSETKALAFRGADPFSSTDIFQSSTIHITKQGRG